MTERKTHAAAARSAVPRTIHSDHLKLMREREPWDVPVRLLQPSDLEPLQDIPSEDFILSFMLANPGRVSSLDPADFTGRDRPVIYEALRTVPALPLETLDKLDERLDCPGYINQLRWQSSHTGAKPPIVKECIANLKRLRELRALASAVDRWRREMPTMTVRSARHALAAMVFPCVNRAKEAR
jgi:hypothetical protein